MCGYTTKSEQTKSRITKNKRAKENIEDHKPYKTTEQVSIIARLDVGKSISCDERINSHIFLVGKENYILVWFHLNERIHYRLFVKEGRLLG